MCARDRLLVRPAPVDVHCAHSLSRSLMYDAMYTCIQTIYFSTLLKHKLSV